ncbi:hypothetical protein [Paenibacillus piri]|uniref:Lipoprotein n=1 Tax=Paenibacillus piri TaxID=2547395 RepID=A0A4R5KJQ5_9BACL|nr:hypothetical protein [Paenibacillus piri]TDF95055.1 hypothetical protein E1757_21185 [Paenibacillus piri]
MGKRTSFVPLWILLCLLAFAGCSGSGTPAGPSSAAASDAGSAPSAPPWPAASVPVSAPEQAETRKEDLSVRAVGKHPAGQLLVKPASKAEVVPLRAPSCYGQETDLSWRGDYEALWEPSSGGEVSNIMPFPADFEIIQRDDTPLEMQPFRFGETDLFAYVPRYTDCHALETYLFGVSGGEVFPVTFELTPERIWGQIDQLPNRRFKVIGNELIVTGGYGAGQDYINMYHFRYDAKKKSMVLQQTDLVKPNEIEFDD